MDHTPNYPTDQEIWKDIPGFEGSYQASSFGQVRSLDRIVPKNTGYTRFAKGRILQPGATTTGYKYVRLSTLGTAQNFLVHYIVMLTFAGPRPNGYEINHKDGHKANNRLENLEYVTTSENKIHAYAHGLSPIGSARSDAKLNEQSVREIKQLLAAGFTQARIADQFGVTIMVISNIKHGKSWKHVQ